MLLSTFLRFCSLSLLRALHFPLFGYIIIGEASVACMSCIRWRCFSERFIWFEQSIC
ncbi:hypothetical protein BJ508DRAFT_94058 [Ascobolus immersus RN42]|uniref:Uncharacterized protein n=1 Tax=Ascobolus immersus RN42 TaxID=1160509 RepID=A0A3N4IZ92_ASCIM|nr:hypothetical protein BJ508DRAFT_94058 [Ascobolus immersus RN42]